MSDIASTFQSRLPGYGPFVPTPQVDSSSAYNFQDDFDLVPSVANLSTSGLAIATGQSTWWAQAISGSPATQLVSNAPVPQPNHPGTLRLRTSATINAGLGIRRGTQSASSSTYIRTDQIEQLTVWFAIPVVTNTRIALGIDGEPLTAALTDGAVLILDRAIGPSFLFSAAQAGQLQTFDTGIVPVASSPNTPIWWKLDILQDVAGIYALVLNDQPIVSLNCSAFSPGLTNVGASVQALTASQPELQLDFWSVRSRPLDRYSD